jgi:ABC-type uncharacterized transport system auxiliary subunit
VKSAYYLRFIALGLLVSTFACSWGQDIPQPDYYYLYYTPKKLPIQGSRRPYPYSIQIGRFEVQRIFNRQNIVYRYSANQIQFYELERWAVRPDYMIKDQMLKHLEASEIVNRLGEDFFDTRPDFRFEGIVESIERFDAGDVFYAHLGMTLRMLKIDTGAQVWSYSFDERRRVYARDMVNTVIALSSILESQMNTVVTQLDSLFLSMGDYPVTPAITVSPQDSTAPMEIVIPPPADSTGSGLNESDFKIIREKR